MRWRDFPARPPRRLGSGPLRPRRPSRRTPLLASKLRSGAPRLPRPSSWERAQVQRAAGIGLRTLLRFPGRLQGCPRCAPGRGLFTALRHVRGRRHSVAWEGVWKHRIPSGRREVEGRCAGVRVHGLREGRPQMSLPSTLGDGEGKGEPAWELRTWELRLRPLVPLVP